jgi:hypothetical protein
MQVEIFTLCDAATVAAGKMNLLGSFDRLFAEGFPARHHQCAVACKVRFDENDSGEHDLVIKIIDPDGNDVIKPSETKITKKIAENRTSVHFHIWQINGFRMPKPGEFFIDLILDGNILCRQPLYVEQIARRSS